MSDHAARSPTTLSRRDALKAASTLCGAALVMPGLLAGCTAHDGDTAAIATDAATATSHDEATLLEDIADVILPTTASSPGAKAAGVGATMALLLADCRSLEVQQRIAHGLRGLRDVVRSRGAADFALLSPDERMRLLRELDDEAERAGATHWFADLRELALGAYFSSETGMTRALRYVRVPGRYRGCIPLAPGQPAEE